MCDKNVKACGNDLIKGLGVIVASRDKKNPDRFLTDSIVNCDAKCFSISSPVILQESDLKKVNADKPLYLCGHGSKRNHKISGYTIKEIAAMLKEHGYEGKQTLFIASCWSARVYKGRTMAEHLESALNDLGIECTVIALADAISIVYESSHGNAVCASVNYPYFVRKVLFEFQGVQFPSFAVKSCRNDVSENYSSVMAWNTDVVKGHYNALFACNADMILFTIACVFAFVCYFVGIPISVPAPAVLLWLLAEFTSFRGYAFSILIWIPVIVAGLQWHAFVVLLRLLLGVALTVFLDCKYVLKFIS